DVLYAPGISAASDLRSLVSSVDLPVNVLALPAVPPVAELTEIGVKRVSVGGAFAWAALGAAADAARELLEQGTYGYWDVTARGAAIAKPALGS
ncbi:MAG TPA: isocitrate lyase/phosphoenolpyruvate mutase family protein, partial [Acidimicrobiia bacterium]|nr:isocitrate lyase/phosphoenolpyruvate mutase family protein [Acidimicrobiia bacterium]